MLPPTKKNMTMIGVVGDGGEDPAMTELLDLDEDEDEEDEEDEGEEDSETENFDITDAQELLMLERLQFKQISVGEAYSCGIVMHEDKASEEVIFGVFFFVVLFLLRYRLWILYSLLSLTFFCTYAFLASLYGGI
jgi:hypothetical protein